MFTEPQINHPLRIVPWLIRVEPYPEESLSHYLGRFRRGNPLSSAQLSALLKQRSSTVSYWETPSHRRPPRGAEITQLIQYLGIEETRLRQMWLPQKTPLHLPTRLCAQCYLEAPYHRLTWQQRKTVQCDRHQQPLLSACPQCKTDLPLPAHWYSGQCDQCRLPFQAMVIKENSVTETDQKGKAEIMTDPVTV